MMTPTSTASGTIKKDHSAITKLPTFAERGTAIAKRLESVKADPKYQALPEDRKAKVRADLYNKYVPKSYSGFHLPVPDKETWVGATGRATTIDGKKLSETYVKNPKYWDVNTQQSQDTRVGASKALDGIALFGARVTNKVFSAMHGLDEHFSHPDGLIDKFEHHVEAPIQKQIGNFIDSQKAKIQSSDFWLETHPRDTRLGKLDSTIGELVATLPLYEAVGAFGLGGKLGTPFTTKLATSAIGKFVTKRLITASDWYLASLAESGGSNAEGIKGAVGGLVGEAGIKVAGKVFKAAAAPLIKKWTANTVAMGGIPFAQDLAQSAYHEITASKDWFMLQDKIENVKFGASHDLGLGIRVHPETEGTGHFSTKDGQIFKYQGKQHQQTVFNELMHRAETARTETDPVLAKLHEAEKVSLESIAVAKFKMGMESITDKQKLEVLGERWKQITQAAQEAPVHLPDLHKNEIEVSIEKSRAANPMFNSLAGELEKYGIKLADSVTENNIEIIAKETGISNTARAANKVAKATKLPGTKIDEKAFASYKIDSIASMRAPRNRVEIANAISDRQETNLNKFIDTMKKFVPAGLKFEDPAHMMLFHYGNAEKLEPGIKKALRFRLNQTKGYENATSADLRRESGMLQAHLLSLARSGKLVAEGNVFRSTKTVGPYSWTKWQTQLSDEVINETIKPAQKALKNHPHALKGFNASIAALKKTRPNLKTAEEVIAFESGIAEATNNIVKHKADKYLGPLLQ